MLVGRVWPERAVAAAAVQAVASGLVLWAGLPGRRWIGAAVGLVMLAGVAWGSTVSTWAAREAPTGLAHAILYLGLAAWFGRSLRPGRVAVVTAVAARLNPRFRAEMIPYTRRVTAVWCAFSVVQLVASALLLLTKEWRDWALLVGGGHAVLAAALAAGEYATRCWRFPGEHTGFWDTVRGFRR